MSDDREERLKEVERAEAPSAWLTKIRKTVPVEDRIELIWTRFDEKDDKCSRETLRAQLAVLLHETGQHGEVLKLDEARIAEDPDDVFVYIGKSRSCHCWLDDFDEAPASVELAVACDPRTGKWLRVALGYEARILVDMRRGDDLTAVLEDLMALKLTRGAIDMARERDFVDAAPPGLFPADVLAAAAASRRCARERPKFDEPQFGRTARKFGHASALEGRLVAVAQAKRHDEMQHPVSGPASFRRRC